MLSKTLDFKFAKENTDFFNTLVYIDINNRIQTNVHKKRTTDRK